MITGLDFESLILTLKVASTSTLIMIFLGTPLAWWLARTRSKSKVFISALVSLPLVLPPTVLGFYMLLLFGPSGPIGRVTEFLGLGVLPFTYNGLVVASVIYSVPFVVQPLYASFTLIEDSIIEVASTLGAGPLDRFFSVVIPMSVPGFLMAGILGFAHTVGEFGVVLMIGGNIPRTTRVVSIQLYNHVEAQEYIQAHLLAGILLLFSFFALISLFTLARSHKGLYARR